jgi:hypothetical protein
MVLAIWNNYVCDFTSHSISELKRPSHEQPSPLKIADERGFFQGQSGHLVQKSGHPERVKADSFWDKRGQVNKRTSVVFQLCNTLYLTRPNSSRGCSSLKSFGGLRNALQCKRDFPGEERDNFHL